MTAVAFVTTVFVRSDRVVPGRYRPGAPAAPYVRTLAHRFLSSWVRCVSEGRTDSANRRKRVSEWSIKVRQPGDFVTERIQSTVVTCPSGEEQLLDGLVEIHRVAIESVHTARIYDDQHLALIGVR
jgi:hypothetical protein